MELGGGFNVIQTKNLKRILNIYFSWNSYNILQELF